MKRKEIISLAAVMFLMGCGGSDDTAPAAEVVVSTEEVNQAREMLDAMNDNSAMSGDAYAMSKNIDTGTNSAPFAAAGDPKSCLYGGTFALTNWDINLTQFHISVDVVKDGCNSGFGVTSGTVNFEVSEYQDNVWQYVETFVTDYTKEREPYSLTVGENSLMSVRYEKGETNQYVSVASYTITGSKGDMSRTNKADNWVHNHTVLPDVTWCPVEGRVYVDNLQRHYDVYSGYNACATPFTLDGNGVVISGQSQYLGNRGELIKFEVVTPGTFTVWLDPDGPDGSLGFAKLADFPQ